MCIFYINIKCNVFIFGQYVIFVSYTDEHKRGSRKYCQRESNSGIFFWLMRGERIQIPLKPAIIGQPAKRHLVNTDNAIFVLPRMNRRLHLMIQWVVAYCIIKTVAFNACQSLDIIFSLFNPASFPPPQPKYPKMSFTHVATFRWSKGFLDLLGEASKTKWYDRKFNFPISMHISYTCADE